MTRFVTALLLALLAGWAIAGEDNTVSDRLDVRSMDLDFEETPLSEVLARFSEVLDAPVLLDPELLKTRTEGELRVTIRLEGVTARTALDCLLLTNRLGAEIHDDLIIVKDRENIEEPKVTEEHDLAGVPVDAEWEVAERSGMSFLIDMDFPVSIFGELIAPGSWDPPNMMDFREGKLVIRHSAEVQDEMRKFVADLRAVSARQVGIELSVYRLSSSTLDEIRPAGPYPEAGLARRLDLRIDGSDGLAEGLLVRSSAVTPSGVRGAIATNTSRPFVRERRAALPEGSAPVVDWTAEPFRARFVSVILDDGQTVQLHLRLEATLDRGVLDLPHLSRCAAVLRPTIPQGRCMVAELGGSTLLVVEVSPRKVPLPERVPEAENERERLERELLERLRRAEIDADYQDRPFAEIVGEIARVVKVNIVVDRSVTERYTDEELKVDLDMGRARAWRVLDILCGQNDLRAVPFANVLLLTTRESDLAREKTSVVLHDLRELALDLPYDPVRSAVWPRQTVPETRSPFEESFEGSDPDPMGVEDWDLIAYRIYETVDPETWDSEGCSLRPTMGRLAVAAPSSIHELLASTLDRWRKDRKKPLVVRATRFVAGPGFLGQVPTGVISTAHAAELGARLARGGALEVERLSAPGVEGRWVGVGRGDVVYYASSEPGASDWYRAGLGLDVRATPAPGGTLELVVEVESARLLGAKRPDSPRVARARFEARALLASGEALLLTTSGQVDESGGTEYLLIEVQR